MVQKTRLATLLGLGGALLMSGAAYAQPPAGYSGGSPGSMSGGSMSSGIPSGGISSGSTSPGGYPSASSGVAGTSGSGAVSNAPGTASSTDYSSTDASSTDTIGSGVQDSSTLARTGGEPWMMALAGATLAIGALSLRRRIN